ncbi:MAG TPA: uroporphyrinogen-III synthase [Anaerolineaceae bacterium]|nr:uroporphyrinogen-III synthase [Anaerolineaceae bacterium]
MLLGKGVLVTRPVNQAEKFAEQLIKEGAKPILFPTTKIVPDPIGQNQLLNCLGKINQYDWIIFTSQNAVVFFWEEWEKIDLSFDKLKAIKIAAVGPVTKQKLNDLGLTVTAMPDIYIGEEIVNTLGGVYNQHILIPRAEGARSALVEALNQAGAIVNQIILYKSITNSLDEKTWNNLENNVHYVTFTSASTVHGFFDLLGDQALQYLKRRLVACIGPITAQTLLDYGISAQITAQTYTIEGLIEEMKAYSSNNTSQDFPN